MLKPEGAGSPGRAGTPPRPAHATLRWPAALRVLGLCMAGMGAGMAAAVSTQPPADKPEAGRGSVTFSAWQAAEAAKAQAKAQAEAARAASATASAPAALQALRPAEPPRNALPPAQAPDLAPHAKTVHEDAQVRIEESRQRGQVREVQVKSKLPNVPGYEIQLGSKGRDPSQDTGSRGKRTWSVLDF